MRAPLRAALCLLILQASHSAVVWAACACEGGTGTLEDRLDTYDQVFIGAPIGGCGCGTRTTTFEVLENFTGTDIGAKIEVIHPVADDECGLRFIANDDYLVYVLDGMSDSCDPGGSVAENQREVEELRELTE